MPRPLNIKSFPTSPFVNVANGLLGYAKFFGKVIPTFAVGSAATYFKDLSNRQLRGMMSFFRFIAVSQSRITVVIGSIASIEVLRVAAKSVVARMQHPFSLFQRSNPSSKGDSMRYGVLTASYCNLTVTVPPSATTKNPAGFYGWYVESVEQTQKYGNTHLIKSYA
jgi:hypothetical protein